MRCHRFFSSWLALFLLLAIPLASPSRALADKELKAKTKRVFKDTGEVFKHIYRKTKKKTVKVVNKIDHKLGGDGGGDGGSGGESK